MRVFQRVIDEGGFAAAARALDMSPAVITRLVADLESHLNVRLLHRTTRRIALTHAGENYLQRVRGILQELDEVEAATSAQAEELAGVLRVLAPPAMATHLLAPALAEFTRRYPRIELDIEARSTEVMPVEDYDITLIDENADIDAEHVRRKIIDSFAILVASPQYLQRAGIPSAPEDLMQHACLRIAPPGRRLRPWKLWQAHDANSFVELQVPTPLRANHPDTLMRAVIDGAGITSTAFELAAPYLATGQLQHILPTWTPGHVTVYAAFPTRKFLPQRTRVFLDFLVDHTRALSEAARAVANRE